MSTLVIGLAASFLAYRQFMLGKAKLKYDLYEKRLALFNKVRTFASSFILYGETEPGEKCREKLYAEMVEMHFLFDQEICTYVDNMYKKSKDYEQVKLELSTPNLSPEKKQALDKSLVANKVWFFDQHNELIKLFSKDLSIKSLR